MKKTFSTCISIVCIFSAEATTTFDQQELTSLLLCDRLYQEQGNLAYEADKLRLKTITDAVLKELGLKYSKKDFELMQVNASRSAMMTKITTHRGKFCTDTMDRLNRQKSDPLLKSYLIPG